ncbi:MAG: heme A synthase [Microcystis flos-aquae DF17]|uniref:COX15/CtaA family protein n=1 Tax=Microcystis sp. M53598_WE2 TaxID=3030677 RepID=UPI000E398AE3|nr:heme A synthase [Microcystis sp. M53598_WE2]MCE2672676.1 heme A synthase [Microcystis sp. 53598_E5]MDJ0673258.1 heme A synthase [Microcystis sp. M53598_WE2]REJ39611.1 MAG: heme A synthase [Microcystis flos-aquae DF17]
MTESVFNPTPLRETGHIQVWMRRLVWKIAIATFALMVVGAATRVMNAGLACPDWPLCYGQWIPSQQMNLQVFLEWFHRLDASLIGFSTLALVGLSWWYRRHLPTWLLPSAIAALALILLQGVLGGLTVTQLLRFDIVTAHLATALLFFSTLIVIAIGLTPYRGTGTVGKLTGMGMVATGLVYLQCLLGGLVGSRWAAHQCLTVSQLCTVMNSHIIGVFPATISVLTLVFFAWRAAAIHPLLKKLAFSAGGLVALQVFLGVATLKLHLQVEPLTITHHSIGALLVGTLVAFTTFALRDCSFAPISHL